MIVSKPTQNALMELIKQCFIENRKLDRIVSILGVKFAMNETANLIHQNIAHYFPALSDRIGELCLERYNISVLYGETPSAFEDYDKVVEIIHLIENRIIDFQSAMMAVCKIAFENNDINVYTDMLGLLAEYNKLVEQAILLADKIDYYGEDKIMKFDHDISHFWILGENGK